MDDNAKPDVTPGDEQVPVNEFEKAVKDLAARKSQAFGPTDRELAARRAELQRQKVQMHREGKL